jgi:basic amino acid/polyamine antiporter, APA family
MASSEADYKLIDQKIGLVSGIVLMMGTVIGISVFILPGTLIAQAGPSIVLALAITALPMVFSVLSLLQLGGALPVAGGVYVYGSRLVGPFWGFLSIWLVIPAIWSTLMFTSIGFAEFTSVLLGIDIPREILMAMVLGAFLGLNLKGITFVARAQLLMVGFILLAIAAFVLPGIGQVEAANYTPLFPQGTAPFLIAVVSLYIPFQGFAMIVELGEELEDPIRNIPRVLLFGMGLAVVLSLALVTVFVGLDDWQTLAALGEGGIASAAGEYLPAVVGLAIAIAAILGAFTTLNAVITSYSRTLMRASRDGIISPKLAEISDSTQVPHWAILVLALPPIAFVPFSPSVVVLTVFLALIILFSNFIGAIALWNLPKRYPERYEHSIYKLPMWLLKTSAIGSAVFAVLFWLAVLRGAPMIAVVLLAFGAVGYVYYRFRVRQLSAKGVDLTARLKQLHAHEAETAAGGLDAESDDIASLEGPSADGTVVAASGGPNGEASANGNGAVRGRRRFVEHTFGAVTVMTAVGSAGKGAAGNGASGNGASGKAVSRDAVSRDAVSRDAAAGNETDVPVPDDELVIDLTDVPGLGPARIEALLDRFDSPIDIRDADPDDLAAVPGIGPALSRRILDHLR